MSPGFGDFPEYPRISRKLFDMPRSWLTAFSQNERFKCVEKMTGLHLLSCHEGQVVVDEHVDAWASYAALNNVLAPERCLELAPVLFVKTLYFGPTLCRGASE